MQSGLSFNCSIADEQKKRNKKRQHNSSIFHFLNSWWWLRRRRQKNFFFFFFIIISTLVSLCSDERSLFYSASPGRCVFFCSETYYSTIMPKQNIILLSSKVLCCLFSIFNSFLKFSSRLVGLVIKNTRKKAAQHRQKPSRTRRKKRKKLILFELSLTVAG